MSNEENKSDRPRSKAIIAKDMEALGELILIAKALLMKTQTRPLQRTLRYFAVSLSNSSVAVAILCDAGHGADAMKIARSMFETYVSFRYLLFRPEELEDFLAFDAVARYNRLQYYKNKLPETYSSFQVEKIKATNDAYRAVRRKFIGPKGKVRDRWCRHSLAEMARVTHMSEMYDLVYRHASMLHHADPMGLAMLIDGKTLEIQPGPTGRHIGVAMRIASLTLHETLSEYSKLVEVDNSEILKRIDGLISGVVEAEGDPLGPLAAAYLQAADAN